MDAAAWLAAVAIAGCSAPIQQSAPEAVPPVARVATITTPAAQARADSGRPAYTLADVQFMQGMIAHHAQAVVMAAMAPAHGARADVRILAQRIDVAQRDEIAFMQRWLRERREMTPDASAQHDMADHKMPGPAVSMRGMAMSGTLMPGMLTHEQLMQLDEARGAEFDRLFLTFMIQHHQGALTMVERLFSSPGAGQEGYVFRFASDVSADQTTEIDRMRTMLSPRSSSGGRP